MNRTTVLLGVVLLVACKNDITTDKPSTDPSTTNPQTASVLTQHNDNTRAGWNSNETALTTSNVNAQHFGKVFALTVDDQVYAQPLVAGGITIDNGLHNVVYVATVNNTLYAFDGDNGKEYWQRNFTAPFMRPPRNTDMTGACGGGYNNFSGNIGIVGTPVIDDAKRTIYFVARSMKDSVTFIQQLHAVDLVSGNEVAGGPVTITATASGSGDGSINNVITFDGQRQNQRQGLTLANGIVYVTFSSHCDWGPYHGWILGYDATTLQQQVVYNVTPDGYAGGMWESGAGMAADAQGNLYVVTGNGTVGTSTDPTSVRNRGESALKLTPAGATLQVSSFFTPFNYQSLNDYDLDYGTPGAFLIPNSSYYVTGAKDGTIFLLNKDNMGGFQSSVNLVQQSVSLGSNATLHAQPAYFKGASKEFVYIWSENDRLRAIPFNRASGLLDQSAQIVSSASGPTGANGAVLSVSSNGSVDGTGIVWAAHAFSGDAESYVTPGVLRAFDANDVTNELWDNLQNGAQDGAGNFAKFAAPTIANGHVYLPTFSNQVVVYGLR